MAGRNGFKPYWQLVCDSQETYEIVFRSVLAYLTSRGRLDHKGVNAWKWSLLKLALNVNILFH